MGELFLTSLQWCYTNQYFWSLTKPNIPEIGQTSTHRIAVDLLYSFRSRCIRLSVAFSESDATSESPNLSVLPSSVEGVGCRFPSWRRLPLTWRGAPCCTCRRWERRSSRCQPETSNSESRSEPLVPCRWEFLWK